jgi:hypothetical protein
LLWLAVVVAAEAQGVVAAQVDLEPELTYQ